jgi:uncharacterized protein with PIN domain
VDVTAVRFLADAMLGRLARWLRVIGADTLQLPVDTPDGEIVQRAIDDDRILLTRDRHLLRELRPPRAIEITSDAPLQQLAQVIAALDLARPAELLTRCLLCNVPLDLIEEDRADPRERPGPVRRCGSCHRMYWRGSHVRRMEAALARTLGEWARTAPQASSGESNGP